MKKIVLLILLTFITLMAKESSISLPPFELDVQYSKNAKEQLIERNEIITLVITVFLAPKSKISHFIVWNRAALVKKEIVVTESTLLSINNIMVDKKYENELDNLYILVTAYSTPAPFESCESKYREDTIIEGSVKSLKNKKHLFEIKVEDDFALNTEENI